MTTPAELLVEFLNKHPEFTVKKKSSAEDIENILAQRDLLELLDKAYSVGYDEGNIAGYSEGHSAGWDAGYSEPQND